MTVAGGFASVQVPQPGAAPVGRLGAERLLQGLL
jgi:hypothetical protein